MTQNNVGIYASQISGHLYSGPYGAYDSLATVTVGSTSVSSITFSGIPSGYKHLQIRALVRSSTGTAVENLTHTQFNSDSGTNYSRHFLIGDGSGTGAYGEANASDMLVIDSANSGTLSNTFAVTILDILDYANTNKYKTVRSLTGIDANGSGAVFLTSGSWRNTAAITSITINPEKTSFVQYSSFALYGVK